MIFCFWIDLDKQESDSASIRSITPSNTSIGRGAQVSCFLISKVIEHYCCIRINQNQETKKYKYRIALYIAIGLFVGSIVVITVVLPVKFLVMDKATSTAGKYHALLYFLQHGDHSRGFLSNSNRFTPTLTLTLLPLASQWIILTGWVIVFLWLPKLTSDF